MQQLGVLQKHHDDCLRVAVQENADALKSLHGSFAELTFAAETTARAVWGGR